MTEDPQIEIVDPSVHVATLNEEGRIKLQAQVKRGRGYVSADRNSDEAMGIGWVPVDSAHSPVRRRDTPRAGGPLRRAPHERRPRPVAGAHRRGSPRQAGARVP